MKRVLLLMIVALAVGALTPTAHAAMMLTMDDPTTMGVDVTITDGVAPDGATDGFINYTGSFGNWTISSSSGLSQLFYGGPVPQMHLNNYSVSSSTGGTLIIGLTDTGLSLSFPSPTYVMESVYGGALASGTTGDIQLWQILDPDNTPFGGYHTSADPDSTNNLVLDSTLIATPPADFSDTISGSKVNPGGTFSLTEWVVLHHDGTGTTSFDIHSTVVPVPAAVVLGILGLGVAGLKLRKYA